MRFTPTNLGNTTSGTFTLFFDGSDVELTTSAEDVVAFDRSADGTLLLSTLGTAKVGPLTANDEDLLRFTPATLGENTPGTWSLALGGAVLGLTTASEDIWGVMQGSQGQLYLSTLGPFAVNGLQGGGADIFVCTPPTPGNYTNCAFTLFWAGSAYGFGQKTIDAFDLVAGAGIQGAAADTTVDPGGEAINETDDALNADEDDDTAEQSQQFFLPLVLR